MPVWFNYLGLLIAAGLIFVSYMERSRTMFVMASFIIAVALVQLTAS